MKTRKLIISVCLITMTGFLIQGCDGAFPGGNGSAMSGIPGQITLAFWNVQNLFDGEDNGNEYTEFRETGGWTEEKYEARLTAISQAIPRMIGTGTSMSSGASSLSGTPSNSQMPDIIGFAEIENIRVLYDLAEGTLSRYGYNWIAFSNMPGASIGLGLISRYPITEVRAHSITIDEETTPRPVLEININIQDELLIILLCHWKSKVGGDDATTPLRQASARVVQRRYLELISEQDDIALIVMGDLNENYDEFHRRQTITALLPDHPAAEDMLTSEISRDGNTLNVAGAASPSFLVLSGERPPAANYFDHVDHAFYSPWFSDMEAEGSYYYRDSWETIDHFLLPYTLFSGSGWEYRGSRVADHTPFINTDGIPNTYNPRSGRGLSDHLPILLFLDFK